MRDREIEKKLKNLFKKYIETSTVLNEEIAKKHSSFDLIEITRPEKLIDAHERRIYREKIAEYSIFFENYKKFYNLHIQNVTKQIYECVSELSEENLSEFVKGMSLSIQRKINEQATLYSYREQWLGALLSLIELFDNSEGDIYFEDDYLYFENDNDIKIFHDVTESINEASRGEAKLNEERMKRLGSGLFNLGNWFNA